jgi:hypothetical protein
MAFHSSHRKRCYEITYDKQVNAQTLSSIETLHERLIELHDGKTECWYPVQRFKPCNRKHFDYGQLVRRYTDAASTTALTEFIAASVLMMQMSLVAILSELQRRKPRVSV